eukprot:GHVQ01023060.1.p1 GENE.GHVQ01023060.1~~GHVQ01023060.1.p1  ORF type:complete len:772 (-),score=97.91 GHVQ01023060.1:3313-5628(-)
MTVDLCFSVSHHLCFLSIINMSCAQRDKLFRSNIPCFRTCLSVMDLSMYSLVLFKTRHIIAVLLMALQPLMPPSTTFLAHGLDATVESPALVYALHPSCIARRLEVLQRVMLASSSHTRQSVSASISVQSVQETRRTSTTEFVVLYAPTFITPATTRMDYAAMTSPSFAAVPFLGAPSVMSCGVSDTWMKEVKAGSLGTTPNCVSEQSAPASYSSSYIDTLLETLRLESDCIVAVERNLSMELPSWLFNSTTPKVEHKLSGSTVDIGSGDTRVGNESGDIRPEVGWRSELNIGGVVPVPHSWRLLQTINSPPTDPHFNTQWELLNSNPYSIQAQDLWKISVGGDGSQGQQPLNTLGIVDGGFLQTHPELQQKWYENPDEICGNGIDDDHDGLIDDCRGWSFTNNSDDLMQGVDPVAFHGTAVSGVAAAATDNAYGIASACPNCRILPTSTNLTFSQIILATNYLISKQIAVINYSFSGPRSDVLFHVLSQAASTTLFVVAAGNSGCYVDGAVSGQLPFPWSDDSIHTKLDLSLETTLDRHSTLEQQSAFLSSRHKPPFLESQKIVTSSSDARQSFPSSDVADSSGNRSVEGRISTTLDSASQLSLTSSSTVPADTPLSSTPGSSLSGDKNNSVLPSVTECYYQAFPAAFSIGLQNVLSVGALASDGRPAIFSNYGAVGVQVFAPGQEVTTTINVGHTPAISLISGTSFSAPIVAAIAVMIKLKYPVLLPCQIRRILIASCTYNPALAGITTCKGQVNGGTALQLAATEASM